MKYKIGIIALTILFLTGCVRTVNFMTYTDKIYPPSNDVEVLRTKPITKEFTEIGELKLRISRRNEETAVLSLREKAKDIGADAIVILGESSGGAVAIPIKTGQGTMYSVVDKRYITALAIKYKEP